MLMSGYTENVNNVHKCTNIIIGTNVAISGLCMREKHIPA